MRSLLGRPSRSYKDVEHDTDGLSAVGSAPYSMHKDSSGREQHRPSYAELHFKRQATHDPHPGSSFSPLPPAFQFGRKNKEQQALVGQRAELDHILEPGFKAASIYDGDDNTSIAGPSRLSSARTAGGLSALSRKSREEALRPSGSMASFQPNRDSGVSRRGLGGVYVDSSGRVHDTEYDPFAGVSEMSRRKSRRRSAFGGHRRGSLSTSDGSDASSDSGGRLAAPRTSYDGRRMADEDKERDEIRRRLEVDRRRLDEVSGYAAARRRSMMSDRASGYQVTANGRTTPSIHSGYDDALSLAPNGRAPSRLSQHALPSPKSPTFGGGASTVSGSSYTTTNTTRQSGRGTSSAGCDESPRKHTETTPPEPAKPELPKAKQPQQLPPLQRPRQQQQQLDEPTSEEYEDAETESYTETPVSARPLSPPVVAAVRSPSVPLSHPAASVPVMALVAPEPPGKERLPPPYQERHDSTVVTTIRSARVPSKTLPKTPKPPKPATKQKVETAPDGATRITGFAAGPPRAAIRPQTVATRSIQVPESVMSHGSSRSSEREHRPKPAERPREQIYPETPAQAKRREEQERRHLRAGRTPAGALTADSVAASSRSRILPEIEIVDDDDPRIVFPSSGPSTRIQSHEHVIRSSSSAGRGNSNKSLSYNDSNRATSAIIEETGGGYVPSRWASGDRNLRVTGEQKERYRPREWGGKHGDLGGRTEQWTPDPKDALKRNIKDLSTNARFGMFRAKKKILRKAEL